MHRRRRLRRSRRRRWQHRTPFSSIAFYRRSNPTPEGVALLKNKRRHRRDIGGAADERKNAVAGALNMAGKDRAEDTFLAPLDSRIKLALGRETCHVGAGTRAAGRAIVSLARTENEIAAVIAGVVGRGAELNMINLRTVGAGDSV